MAAFEKNTPEHDLVNVLAAERARLDIGIKQCVKEDCDNIIYLIKSIRRMEDAIDRYVKKIRSV